MNVRNHPLNQQASKALQKAGLEPNSKALPVLELMLWRLQQNNLAVDPAVESTVREMFRWEPKAAMSYLLREQEPEEPPLPPENLTAPKKLAEELLALLEISESEKNPEYRGAAL